MTAAYAEEVANGYNLDPNVENAFPTPNGDGTFSVVVIFKDGSQMTVS